MTHNTGRLAGGVTRRNVLKGGVAASSVLATGGTAIGSARQMRQDESENIIPVDLFVRPEGTEDEEPTPPAPTDDDLLVERTQGLPVVEETGSDSLECDEGQLTGRSSVI